MSSKTIPLDSEISCDNGSSHTMETGRAKVVVMSMRKIPQSSPFGILQTNERLKRNLNIN